MIRFIIPLVFLSSQVYGQDLIYDTIFAEQISSKDERYENSIELYKKSETWRIWTFPMENKYDSVITTIKEWPYKIQNINDFDLNTSWTKLQTDSIKKIQFEFKFDSGKRFYSSAYQFFGQINLFNGNLQSITEWEKHGRIKTLRIIYNEIIICYVILIDTWQFQFFSIEKYFKNRYLGKYLTAEYEIKTGDKITFEVVDYYPGTVFKDISISEFQIEGAKN
ncbi:MAG: hypothetical protein IPM74_14640 [Crocinitomicaceae bacterium]|nr:hypothetical protein [Crocinitomicaceae bacterium]MBK8927108.1 hypothetical protein [Crocinitomicaceae bacterium]